MAAVPKSHLQAAFLVLAWGTPAAPALVWPYEAMHIPSIHLARARLCRWDDVLVVCRQDHVLEFCPRLIRVEDYQLMGRCVQESPGTNTA